MNKLKLFYLVGLISFINCESPSGYPGASKDIKESKKRGVFIKEYTTKPNPYKINDSMQITVKEAWLETTWRYGVDKNETIISKNSGYQLCINSNEKDIAGTALDWNIGIDGDKNLRSSSNSSLLGDFKEMPGDTIEYKVQLGNILYNDSAKKIIGNFILYKK